jgi:hypothetical protein
MAARYFNTAICANEGQVVAKDLKLRPGQLVVFNGDRLYHRGARHPHGVTSNLAAVTPLRGGGERIVLSLELVSNPNISLFGRVVNDVKDSLSYFGWQNVFFSAVCLPACDRNLHS